MLQEQEPMQMLLQLLRILLEVMLQVMDQLMAQELDQHKFGTQMALYHKLSTLVYQKIIL